MFREQRIALGVFSIFLIYGITSYFSLGGFVTPFFLSKLILLIFSLIFFLLNFRLKKSYFLMFGFFAMLSAAIVDNFTVTFLSERLNSQWLIELSFNKIIIYASFIIYFGFYFFAIFLLHAQKKNKLFTLLLCALLSGVIGMIYLNYPIIQDILMLCFLIAYVVFQNRIVTAEKMAVTVISALFLLQFFLEIFKYFI